MVFVVVASSASAQNADRYLELKRVIDRNTGFAHATRGVNMYTLYALRECVTEKDLPVLERILSDREVLADLSPAGRQALLEKLRVTKDVSERMMLQEALDDAQKRDYQPILQYPLNAAERANIRGCK
jgi:hypothetical protein